jgi:hypothetical protein
VQENLTIRVKKSFPTNNVMLSFREPGVLVGNRYYVHGDGPFEVDRRVGERLLKDGTVDAAIRLAGQDQRAVDPKPAVARR